METKKIVAGLALAAATIAGVVILDEPGKPIDTQKEVKLGREELAIDINGNKVYIIDVKCVDGGIEKRLAQPSCKRKLADKAVCTRSDGGDPGLFNRYDNLIGPDCEVVACQKQWDDIDPDKNEDQIIQDIKDGKSAR